MLSYQVAALKAAGRMRMGRTGSTVLTKSDLDRTRSPQEVKYPHIEVELIGRDGNAFGILAAVRKEMNKDPDIEKVDIDEFLAQATSGDYYHLLQVVKEWVTVV